MNKCYLSLSSVRHANYFLAAIIFLHILQVMDYSDTDVAEYLYKTKPDLDSLKSFLCKDLTKACSKAPPPVPKVMSFFMTLRFNQYIHPLSGFLCFSSSLSCPLAPLLFGFVIV